MNAALPVSPKAFAGQVLRWFDQHGRKDLPASDAGFSIRKSCCSRPVPPVIPAPDFMPLPEVTALTRRIGPAGFTGFDYAVEPA
ncbi:MAG: hypothetical protein ACE37N_12455 [Pseudohongiellaceae bacterium]